MQDHYATLGVAEDADSDAIHDAYRTRAQQHHPDKVRHLAVEFQELAESRMRAINAAYDVLHDKERRRAYDAEREQVTSPAAQTAAQAPDAEPTPAPETTAQVHRGSSTQRRFALVLVAAAILVAVLGVLFVNWRRDVGIDEWADASANFERARESVDNQRWEDAILLLQRTTRARPSWFEAWDLRWRAELTLGLYRDAASSLERAIELSPTTLELRVAHARARFRLGDVRRVAVELLWLRKNGEAARVDALLAEFRSQNSELAKRLGDIGARARSSR